MERKLGVITDLLHSNELRISVENPNSDSDLNFGKRAKNDWIEIVIQINFDS